MRLLNAIGYTVCGLLFLFMAYHIGRHMEARQIAPEVRQMRLEIAGYAAREGICSDIIREIAQKGKIVMVDGPICFKCHGHGGKYEQN